MDMDTDVGLESEDIEDDEGEEKQPEARLTDDDILKLIAAEVDQAGEDQSERLENQADAVDYFYGRSPGLTQQDVEAEMNGIVSTDVADAVESVLAEIIPAFTGTAPVEFVPANEQDEAQADIETRAVNHVVNSAGSFMAINMAAKDALLRRAGVIKVWWEEVITVAYNPILDVPIDSMPQIMEEGENEAKELAEANMDEQTGMVTGSMRTYTKKGKPRISAVPRDEFLISSDAFTPDADAARFVAHQRAVSRSYLIQLGFDPDEVNELKAEEITTNQATSARFRTSEDISRQSPDKSTDLIMAVEAYYRIDMDGDGIAELRRIITAGGSAGTDELLLNEPWDQQPFCIGVPYIGIYSWDGVSLFDKLKSVQDTKTELLRDLLNASRRNVRQRTGVIERNVNMDDMLTSVMGGVVRMKDLNSVFPLPNVEVPPQLFNVLGYIDEVRKDKGGGAIDSAAQVNALAGDTAHGLERMMSAAEQINAMVAKNLAETLVKPLYLKMHNLLRQYQKNPLVVPGSTGWQTANPMQWSPRDSMVVSLGMSVGERTRRTATLQMILQTQMTAVQAGKDGTLVTDDNIYQTVMDLVRMSGLPSPEQYFQNPQSPQAQQAAQQKQQAAQQQAQITQQVGEKQMNIPIEMEKMRGMATVESARIRSESARQIEAMKDQTTTQIESMKAEMSNMQAALDHITKTMDQRIDIAKLNAEFDGEQVPDTLEQMPKGNEVQGSVQ
jgi:hypothetical protein